MIQRVYLNSNVFMSPPHPQYLLQIGASSCRSFTPFCMCVRARACAWIWGHVYCVNARGQTLIKSCCPRRHHTGFFTRETRTKWTGRIARGVAALVIKFLSQRPAALKHRRGAESHWQVRVLSLLHHMLSFCSFGPVCIPAKQRERLIIMLVN